MKIEHENRIYDTDTATHLASWDNEYFFNDCRRLESDLYITPEGYFFCTGSTKVGDYEDYLAEDAEDDDSDGIFTLNKKTALWWLEEHDIDVDDIDEFDKYFFYVEHA